MTLSLLLALAASPAHAESEILFKTSRPVLIFVDGRQTPLTSNLRMRAADLDPGSHEITVKGVFGKTLYEGEIALEDWTVAHAEWADGDLEVTRTETIARRGQRARQGSPWAEEPEAEAEAVLAVAPEPAVEPAPAEESVAVEAAPAAVEGEAEVPVAAEAPAAAPAPVAVAAAPAAAPVAAPVAAVDPQQAALAVPAAAPEVAGPAQVEIVGAVLTDKQHAVEPSEPGSAPIRIQAREGMRFQIETDEASLVVEVVDGAFVLDFE